MWAPTKIELLVYVIVLMNFPMSIIPILLEILTMVLTNVHKQVLIRVQLQQVLTLLVLLSMHAQR